MGEVNWEKQKAKRDRIRMEKQTAHLPVRILAKIRLHHVDNPVLSREIEQEFQLSGAEIRSIIHGLREDGEPIASCGEGYFYAQTYNELDSTVQHIKSRAMSMLGIVNKMTARFDGQQQTIFG